MSDRNRRNAAPSPAGFSTAGRRTALGYWVPLAITVTAAVVGITAWVLSERRDDDHDEDDDNHKDNDVGERITLESVSEGVTRRAEAESEDGSVISKVHGVLRRAPSPSQLFDGASRRVVAGVSAAGSVVGSALSAIREEPGNGDFEDHSRWAEAAPAMREERSRHDDSRFTVSGALQPERSKKNRRTVAIVVSSVPAAGAEIDVSAHESILSQLPQYAEPELAKVFVLIYAPGMQPPVGGSLSSSRPTLSVASSYEHIGPDEAAAAQSGDSPKPTPIEPQPIQEGFDSTTPLFRTLYNQAQVLVDKDTMIMPFNTPTGYIHILRHLSPDIVYIQEGLSGTDGSTVKNIAGWVQHIVLVLDDVSARSDRDTWWERDDANLGKHFEVVELPDAGKHWQRRVNSNDR